MCGLIGIAGPNGADLIKKLIGGLRHRGPDDQGIWVGDNLALGHRRLSIIGLDRAGRQTMLSQSKRSILVYNVEIYNYLELAEELEHAGYRVDRRFDSSILLEALEVWGVEALPKLNGMFAFAWHQFGRDEVLLARDRWGKKPLFFGRVPGTGGANLVFSSELRTFAELPGGPPAPDPLGVARYLVYDGMPGERTVYKDVEKVPVACWARVDLRGHVRDRGRYWSFAPETGAVDPRLAQERATKAIGRALDLRLRSDVPVGLFLSGGIDSSILAAVWRKDHPEAKIRTFTVGFEDATYDERQSARLMAQSIGSEHHEVVATGEDLTHELAAVLDGMPEPLADPSIVPTSLLSRFARNHVTVALGGDGGDELQAGYDPFRAWTVAKAMTGMAPGRIWDNLLRACEQITPANSSNMSLKFKLHHFRQGLALPKDERIQGWLASFPVHRALATMQPELADQVDAEELLAPTRNAYRIAEQAGELHAQMHTWISSYLECCILAKVDRASMMHSLEVRAPLLDPDVADSLTSLPPSLIFSGGRGKVLLRSIARELLPPEVQNKPKKGLGVPLGSWFKTVLKERMEDSIAANADSSWFRKDVIQEMWREHLAGRYDHRKALWNFLVAISFQTSVKHQIHPDAALASVGE